MHRKKLLQYSFLFILLILLGGSTWAGGVQSIGKPGLPADQDEQTIPMAAPNRSWLIKKVDAPSQFGSMGPRSLALDSAGHPHIAYGRDHLYYAYYDGASWQIETVDSSLGVGSYTSLALDSTDRPHITYYDAPNADLKYAYHNGSYWQIETLDSAGEVGRRSSLALDNDGAPHVSYCDETNESIKYAHHKGSTWHVEPVEIGGCDCLSALAMWDGRYAHIAYNGPDNKLKYAYQVETGWHTEVINWNLTASSIDMAMDSEGRPHIGFLASNPLYIHYDGSDWVTMVIDPGGNYEFENFDDISIDLDPTEQPHFAYRHTTDWASCVEYAYYDGSEWQINCLKTCSTDSALVMDGNGLPHLSFLQSKYGLSYAYNDGTDWYTEAVDPLARVSYCPVLDLDSEEHPRIIYTYKYTDNGQWKSVIKYATFDGLAWHFDVATPSSIGTNGGFPALRLDSADRPHVIYYDCSQHPCSIVYTHLDGTNWISETIEQEINSLPPNGAGFALDQAGAPHVIYGKITDDYVWYAYLENTDWHTETVVTDGSPSSLALDSADHPHIIYYHRDSDSLMYTHFTGSDWQTSHVGPGDDIYTYLVLDPQDDPHLTYILDRPAGFKTLVYAHLEGTEWITSSVDQYQCAYTGAVYPVIDMNGEGLPCISYRDPAGDKLNYACLEGTNWTTETVNTDLGWLRSGSLAHDSAGFPHIAYCHALYYHLEYAVDGQIGRPYRIYLPLMIGANVSN